MSPTGGLRLLAFTWAAIAYIGAFCMIATASWILVDWDHLSDAEKGLQSALVAALSAVVLFRPVLRFLKPDLTRALFFLYTVLGFPYLLYTVWIPPLALVAVPSLIALLPLAPVIDYVVGSPRLFGVKPAFFKPAALFYLYLWSCVYAYLWEANKRERMRLRAQIKGRNSSS